MDDTYEDISAIGPFFGLETHAAPGSPTAPWRPMVELVLGPEVLRKRIDAVRVSLAGMSGRDPDRIEPRVAASVAHLGLVARLLAPTLAVTVARGAEPGWSLETIWWQDELGGPYPVSVPASTPAARGTEPVRALTEAVLAVVPVSPQVLWGNVASAVNSATSMIAAHDPSLSGRAGAEGDRLMAAIPHHRPVTRTGKGFRRLSCCLIYRIALTDERSRPDPGSLCGDCALRR
ncbi:(2Fe-2S)-binding protein [Kineosporia mesophila]|uniref:(2Fe-2S)-binding protein n=1 Tax=Kineosporia mesophila TaxID=566012 RepID=A0ABP7AJS8_9ACTN|nr:hypothetical protein [Kineosporia mesophila]MCD5355051.1 hypothetical protein [Kineosporia mesophila]